MISAAKILLAIGFLFIIVYFFEREKRWLLKRITVLEKQNKAFFLNNLEEMPNNTIIKPKYFETDEIKEIAVFKLDHIGDIILAIPALLAIKSTYKNAKITLIAGSWAKELLSEEKIVDSFFEINILSRALDSRQKKSEEKRLKSFLKQNTYDLAIDLRTYPDTRKWLKYTNSLWKVGYSTVDDDSFLDVKIENNFRKLHKVEQILEVVRALGLETDNFLPVLNLTEAEKEFAHKFIEDNNLGSKIIVGMHPSSGARNKMWALDRFLELAEKLMLSGEIAILVIVGKNDVDIVKEITKANNKGISVVNHTNLRETAALAERCSLFISNDSGPMHLAAAVNTPTLGIFSGVVLPNEWGPYGKKHKTVMTRVHCMPCQQGSCDSNICLKSIDVDKVYEIAKEMLVEVVGL